MTSHHLRCALLVLLLTLVTAASSDAGPCFRGKPRPDCRSFWITELGLGFRPGAVEWETFPRPLAEVGWMKNVSDRYALGATGCVIYETGYDGFRGGLKVRGRRWLYPDLSLNVSGGALFIGGPSKPSFTSHVDINFTDVIAPYVGLELHPKMTSLSSGPDWHTGIRFGSYPGAGLTAVAIGYVVAVLYILETNEP